MADLYAKSRFPWGGVFLMLILMFPLLMCATTPTTDVPPINFTPHDHVDTLIIGITSIITALVSLLIRFIEHRYYKRKYRSSRSSRKRCYDAIKN